MVDPPKVVTSPSTNWARRSITVDVTNVVAAMPNQPPAYYNAKLKKYKHVLQAIKTILKRHIIVKQLNYREFKMLMACNVQL